MTPSTKLGVQTLEPREVPAVLSGGTLYVYGTGFGDDVLVDDVTTLTGAKVKVEQDGVTSYFSRSQITSDKVVFYGYGGNDTFNNNDESLKTYAYGGDGRDTLEGSNQSDYLSGGDGDDILVGRAATDILYGGDGNDRLYGEGGGDFLYGEGEHDYLDGGTGVDTLSGGSGNDGLLGGPGDEGDTITGGSGGDRFLDWTNNWFGAGETRTDVTSADAVVFFRNARAQTVTLASNIGDVRYEAGTWKADQIEAADTAFVLLQNETGNTKLLKTSGGGSITVYKAGRELNSDGTVRPRHEAEAGGWNSHDGSFTLAEYGITHGDGSTNAAKVKRVTIHEVAHNWDNEQADYQGWLNISGWEKNEWWHFGQAPAGKVASDDKRWWRDTSARFAYWYGDMNPHEDFATCWERYFGVAEGNKDGTDKDFNDPELHTELKAKKKHIADFMADM